MNYEIPHILEQILGFLDTPELLQCIQVSKTWSEAAQAIRERHDLLLVQKWKYRPMQACVEGKIYIIKLLLTHPEAKDVDFNTRYTIDINGLIGLPFSDRDTLFKTACKYGHESIVKLLVEHSVEKNINLMLMKVDVGGLDFLWLV